jgi:glyoxylase-like metal-dependent hydrolase (beta-lactamase superfamily II)
MDIGTKVRLETFNGASKAPPGCDSREDYWVLIGCTGTILSFDGSLKRYLVQFDKPVEVLGLHCHNPEPNSLYIHEADLVLVGDAASA